MLQSIRRYVYDGALGRLRVSNELEAFIRHACGISFEIANSLKSNVRKERGSVFAGIGLSVVFLSVRFYSYQIHGHTKGHTVLA